MKVLTSIIFMIFLSGCGLNSQKPLPYDMTLANEGYEELVKNNYEQAEAFFDLALSINPVNPYALLNLGVIYQNTSRLEQAKLMYKKVIELNTNIKATHTTDKGFQGKTLTDIAKRNLRALEK